MSKSFKLGFLGTLSLGFSSGVFSASLGDNTTGTGLSLTQDVTVPLSKGFAWVNSKLPAGGAPLEAVIETTLITAIKSIA